MLVSRHRRPWFAPLLLALLLQTPVHSQDGPALQPDAPPALESEQPPTPQSGEPPPLQVQDQPVVPPEESPAPQLDEAPADAADDQPAFEAAAQPKDQPAVRVDIDANNGQAVISTRVNLPPDPPQVVTEPGTIDEVALKRRTADTPGTIRLTRTIPFGEDRSSVELMLPASTDIGQLLRTAESGAATLQIRGSGSTLRLVVSGRRTVRISYDQPGGDWDVVYRLSAEIGCDGDEIALRKGKLQRRLAIRNVTSVDWPATARLVLLVDDTDPASSIRVRGAVPSQGTASVDSGPRSVNGTLVARLPATLLPLDRSSVAVPLVLAISDWPAEFAASGEVDVVIRGENAVALRSTVAASRFDAIRQARNVTVAAKSGIEVKRNPGGPDFSNVTLDRSTWHACERIGWTFTNSGRIALPVRMEALTTRRGPSMVASLFTRDAYCTQPPAEPCTEQTCCTIPVASFCLAGDGVKQVHTGELSRTGSLLPPVSAGRVDDYLRLVTALAEAQPEHPVIKAIFESTQAAQKEMCNTKDDAAQAKLNLFEAAFFSPGLSDEAQLDAIRVNGATARAHDDFRQQVWQRLRADISALLLSP